MPVIITVTTNNTTHMRKTLCILSALATSVAFADTADQVISFGSQLEGSNVWVLSLAEGGPSFSQTQDAITVAGTATSNIWKDTSTNFENVNATAVSEWESFTGQTLTNITAGTHPGAGGATWRNFSVTDTTLTSGSQFTMYITLGAFEAGSLSVSGIAGLTDATVSFAGTTDSETAWLDATSVSGYAANQATIVKITGTLEGNTVSMAIGGNKPSISSVAYSVTPEPTTATLSLLALAGLCARRRRK